MTPSGPPRLQQLESLETAAEQDFGSGNEGVCPHPHSPSEYHPPYLFSEGVSFIIYYISTFYHDLVRRMILSLIDAHSWSV